MPPLPVASIPRPIRPAVAPRTPSAIAPAASNSFPTFSAAIIASFPPTHSLAALANLTTAAAKNGMTRDRASNVPAPIAIKNKGVPPAIGFTDH